MRELYALRPDRMRVVPGADGWAGGLRLHRRRPHRALRPERARRCRRSCISRCFNPLDDHYGLSAAGGRRGRGRHPQRGGEVEQGAARQRGAAVRRAGLCRAGRRGALRQPVRAAQAANWSRPTRARSMPAGRCCSKAGSTGRRCRCRPRTWISWRPSTPRRARSRWPSACRRCCSASRATTPIRTTRRPTACSGARPCCRSPTASAAR